LTNKHLPFFSLIDALKQKDCPLCYLIVNSIESYFDTLLYEDINDIGFKKKFREQSGFCNFHSYKLLKYNDGLAVSLTYRDVIKKKITQYNNKAKKNNKSNKKSTKQCLVCNVANDSEERYFSIMIEYLEDKEFKNAFIKSEGLCIPHFDIIIKKLKMVPAWFMKFHKSKYETILKQLNKFIESCNFSLGDRRPVITKEEKDVWEKAVKIFSGYEGMKMF